MNIVRGVTDVSLKLFIAPWMDLKSAFPVFATMILFAWFFCASAGKLMLQKKTKNIMVKQFFNLDLLFVRSAIEPTLPRLYSFAILPAVFCHPGIHYISRDHPRQRQSLFQILKWP